MLKKQEQGGLTHSFKEEVASSPSPIRLSSPNSRSQVWGKCDTRSVLVTREVRLMKLSLPPSGESPLPWGVSLFSLNCLLSFSSSPWCPSLGDLGSWLTDQGLKYYLIRGEGWSPHWFFLLSREDFIVLINPWSSFFFTLGQSRADSTGLVSCISFITPQSVLVGRTGW